MDYKENTKDTTSEDSLSENSTNSVKKHHKKTKNIFIITGVIVSIAIIGIIIFTNTPQYKYKKTVQSMLTAANGKDYGTAAIQLKQAYSINNDISIVMDLMKIYDEQLIELMQSEKYDDALLNEITAIYTGKDDILSVIDSSAAAAVKADLLKNHDFVWITSKDKTKNYFFINQADSNFSEKNYADALPLYEKVLFYAQSVQNMDYSSELEKRAADGIINCEFIFANQFIEQGRYDEAEKEYDHILEIDKQNAEAYLGKSNICLYQNDLLKAIEILESGKTVCKDKNTYLSDRIQYIKDNTIALVKKRYSVRDNEQEKFPDYEWDFNENGQITEEKEYNNSNGNVISSTKYTYDTLGNIITEESNNIIYEYTYDASNRIIEEKSPTDIYTYGYYDDGKLKETHHYELTNGQSHEKAYRYYDSLGRLVKFCNRFDVGRKDSLAFNLIDPIPDPMYQSFNICNRNNTYLFALENTSNIANAKKDAKVELDYNDNNRFTQIRVSDDTGTYATTTFSYYDSGIISNIKYENTQTDTHEEKSFNELGFIIDTSGQYEYNDKGEIISSHYGNSPFKYEYAYDEKHRIIYSSENSCVGTSRYPEYISNYQYETAYKGISKTGGYIKEYSFSYDELNRLTEMDSSYTAECIRYVDTGSRTLRDANGVLHTNIDGNFRVREIYFDNAQESSYTYSYNNIKTCEADDPDRIIPDVNYRYPGLISSMDWGYYYYYPWRASYKNCSDSDSDNKPTYTYNQLGYAITERQNNTYMYNYEYTYSFIGEID